MKESYNKGIANHIGPESCLDGPRGHREALTGESIGGLLSSENTSNRRPSTCTDAKATGSITLRRCDVSLRRSLRTLHVWTHSARKSRDLGKESVRGVKHP